MYLEAHFFFPAKDSELIKKKSNPWSVLQGGQGAHVSGGRRELRDKTQDNLGVLGEFITNTLHISSSVQMQ